jgi:hypothetical protein
MKALVFAFSGKCWRKTAMFMRARLEAAPALLALSGAAAAWASLPLNCNLEAFYGRHADGRSAPLIILRPHVVPAGCNGSSRCRRPDGFPYESGAMMTRISFSFNLPATARATAGDYTRAMC